ncbi:MAG TPA: sigma-70 family RNA polymerase sigma factor [Solirubrobacteraceae bacterium]|nr:sigma-70 family RNA polymerase sigma factor [Solirubrobacteraceae bacterium]
MAVTDSIGWPGDPVGVQPEDRQRAPARITLIATDERLARQVARDDRAFVAIYDRYHQALYRYCRALLRDESDAQDAAQSTWTQALIALRRGQRDAPLSPWLFRIAHNESVSQVRRRTRHRPVSDADDGRDLGEAHGESASAEQQAIEREQFTQLVDDLHELPDRLRGALLMRELGGLSHDEIATSLGTSVGAAKQSILEARRGLQEFAAGRDLICDEVTRRVSNGDRRTLRGRQIRAHLRVCEPCSAFAAAIEDRRRTLRAYTPMLAAPAAAAGLAHALGGGGVGATATGASATGISASAATTAGLAGAGAPSGAVVAVAGKSATAAIVTKALAGVAVVVAAGATAHELAGNANHHSRAGTGDPHRAAARTPVPSDQTGASHSGVAAIRLRKGAAADRSRALTTPARRAPARAGGLQLSSGAPVADRPHGGGMTLRLPALAPPPRRISHQQIRYPVAPTHLSGGPAQTRAAPTRAPAAPTRAPAPGQDRITPGQPPSPPGQTQITPGQSRVPPDQTRTPPGQSDGSASQGNAAPGRSSFAPGQGDTASGDANTPPSQSDTSPRQSTFSPRHSNTTPISIDDPPGHVRVLPRHLHTPLGQTTPGGQTTPPAQSSAPAGQNNTPQGQSNTSPGQSSTPQGQDSASPEQSSTPQGQGGASAGQADTPPTGQGETSSDGSGTTSSPSDSMSTPTPAASTSPGDATADGPKILSN